MSAKLPPVCGEVVLLGKTFHSNVGGWVGGGAVDSWWEGVKFLFLKPFTFKIASA